MADREAVLRFCAFRMMGDLDNYETYDSMDVFLTEATEKLDAVIDEAGRRSLASALDVAVRNAAGLFEWRAFRKWPEGAPENRVNPINKPLLEAWTVALADFHWSDLEPRKDAIVAASRKAMSEDHAFLDAISTGTGDPRKVKLRFRFVRAIIELAGTAVPIPKSSALVPPASQ